MKLAVLTSGGDSPGMNAAIRAVVRQGIADGHQVFGYVEGYRGLTDDEEIELNSQAVSEIIDRGGTILRTSRFPEFREEKVQKKAISNLRKKGIKGLIVIGGEGSMKGARALAALNFKTIGVPASIDNDVFGTDLAIGFDTALNTVVDVLGKLRDTASSHERIFVVEVMGRHSGAIALNAGLAGGADYICLPDTPVTEPRRLNHIFKLVKERYKRGKTHTLIIVAEGAGPSFKISEAIEAATGRAVRLTILGHIQRGGSPTAMDRLLASRLGALAIKMAGRGESDFMVGSSGGNITAIPLIEVSTNKAVVSPDLYELANILS